MTTTHKLEAGQTQAGVDKSLEGSARDLLVLDFLMTDAVYRCRCKTCARRRLALELPSRIAKQTSAPAHIVAALNAEARKLFADLDAIENGHPDVSNVHDDDIPF